MLFGNGNNYESNKIKIYVPNNSDISDINEKVASGDIIIQDLKFKTADLTCSSGDTKFSNLTCTNMKMESSSDNITLDNIDTSELNVLSESGTMKFDTLTADNSTLKNSSGHIEVNNLKSNGLDVTSKSGVVELQGEIKGKNIINSSSGGIDITSSLPKKDYSYDFNTSSGGCSVNGNDKEGGYKKENPSSENTITAVCRSGNLKVNFKG